MPEISMMPAIQISASGLDAETKRMEVIANNVANAQTTKDENGKVFRRKEVVFASRLSEAIRSGSGGEKHMQGVKVKDIVEDSRPLKLNYKPGHPDADPSGYVAMPNVNPVEEMVDMMSASRAYEANLAAIRIAKNMANQALEILR